MNNNNTGYFEAIWFFIWNMIKNSGVYKILKKIYDGISKAWATSKITNWFREEHFTQEALSKSLVGRVLCSPFTF
ncbi:MAG: hypothetical protein RSC29_00800, partial [Oscillospiraceae bacterium]